MTTASRPEMRVEESPVPSLVAAQTSFERNPPKSKGNDDLLPRGIFSDMS